MGPFNERRSGNQRRSGGGRRNGKEARQRSGRERRSGQWTLSAQDHERYDRRERDRRRASASADGDPFEAWERTALIERLAANMARAHVWHEARLLFPGGVRVTVVREVIDVPPLKVGEGGYY